MGYNQISEDLNAPLELARLYQSHPAVEGLIRPLFVFRHYLMEQDALKGLDIKLAGFRITT